MIIEDAHGVWYQSADSTAVSLCDASGSVAGLKLLPSARSDMESWDRWVHRSRCRVLLVGVRCVVGGLRWGPRVWGVGVFGLILRGCGLLRLGWCWSITLVWWRCFLVGLWGLMFSL